VKLRLIA
jgi:minor histocompatibility antigen H13